MKKSTLLSILIAIILSILISHASAQQGFYVSAQVIPQVGVMFNAAEVKSPQSDYKLKGSKTLGIGAGYNFRSNMGIGMEIMHSSLTQGYVSAALRYTQQFSYLTIPVLFTYNSTPYKPVMFTAKAGPQLGILMKSSIKNATDGALNGSTKGRYRQVTGGAVIGAGGSLRLTNTIHFNIGLLLDGTFTDTEKPEYHNYRHGSAQTYYFHAGVELGIKYFIR